MLSSIMIIDDSAQYRETIIQALAAARVCDRCREAEDGMAGFKALLDEPADLIICDLEMPHLDGFKFISMTKSLENLRTIPVILLTGKDDSEHKIRGLELGASDYVTKPFIPGELVARVKVQLQIKHLQDELKKSNELLTRLAYTDFQTGLFNKRHLMQTLAAEVNRTGRDKTCFSLILLDVDFFKSVNDSYGHQNGDTVLSLIAETINGLLRNYTTVARYGGEEFAIVLPGIPTAGALAVAERLRGAIESLFFAPPMEGLTLTGSFGVATYPSERIRDIDTLLKQADDALYRAKQNGRNRVEAA